MKTSAWLLLIVSGAAVACGAVISQWNSNPDNPIRVEDKMSTPEKFRHMGDEMERMYGTALKDREITVMTVWAEACPLGSLLGCGSLPFRFLKACGETFKEALYRRAKEVEQMGWTSDGGAGSDYDLDGYGTAYDDPVLGCYSVTPEVCMDKGTPQEVCVSQQTQLACPT